MSPPVSTDGGGSAGAAELRGWRVLVTGASRGIGRGVAELLFAEGARVALSSRDENALREVIGEREGHVALVADLARVSEAAPLADRAAQALGGLDALVACAGIAEHAPVGAITAAALERQLAVNAAAPLLLAQQAASWMGQGGAIVLVASTLAYRPAALTAAYAASKAALCAAARTLALELASCNIRVNAVAPGVVDTAMVRALRPGASSLDAQLDDLRALHPRGRLGRPADIAEAVRYLLLASFVTGSVMAVDGGLSLGGGRP